ncbi:MAG: cyclic nucleotide-binding protein [Bacteroidetes bacterium]|nr:MAG: cyclic nucleotide-binding protein [Bacteroidota bacterium]
MTEKIKNEILSIHPNFNKEELNNGLKYFEEKSYKAKDIISEKGKITEYLYFANSSVIRCYYIDKNVYEQTLWMKPEKTFVTEYKSFTSNEKSMFSLQFYENTKALCISRENLLRLYKESNDWALFGVLLTEKLHVTLIDVFVNLLANDATDNYKYIEYMFPKFIEVAPLKDIASMLQVSPVTISRIRGNKEKH